MYPRQYLKVISAIIATAMLLGLQSIMMANLARAEAACHLEPQAADASGEAGAEKQQQCLVRAGRKGRARKQAALRAAHAEVAAASARPVPSEVMAHPLFAEVLPNAQVVEAAPHADAGRAQQEQPPVATRCIIGPGRPSPRRGAWQLAVDRTTGHRCWQLVGVTKRHARASSAAKSSRNSYALSARLGAASASPVTAPAAVGAHDPSRSPEIPTSDVAKTSEAQPINLGQSPVSAAPGVISKPSEVKQGELAPFDLRFAWTADRSSSETSEALVASDPAAVKISGSTMLEQAVASVRGRPAIFLVVFLSVLATILALYGLVAGSLALLRSRRRRVSAAAIRVMPQLLLHDIPRQERAGFTDDQV